MVNQTFWKFFVPYYMSTVCTVHLLFPLRNSAPNLNLNFSYIQWSYLFKSQYFNVPISWSLCCFIWISHMLSLNRLIKPISARWLKCITSFILTSNTRSPKAKSKWSKNKTKQNKTKKAKSLGQRDHYYLYWPRKWAWMNFVTHFLSFHQTVNLSLIISGCIFHSVFLNLLLSFSLLWRMNI